MDAKGLTGSAAIQYEDFQPHSEFKEEATANIILVRLPNFTREQLKVTYVDSSRIIRVQGERERPSANNKRTRFNQSFTVPNNCEISKIHAKFHHEVLKITMPKSSIAPGPPNIVAPQKSPSISDPKPKPQPKPKTPPPPPPLQSQPQQLPTQQVSSPKTNATDNKVGTKTDPASEKDKGQEESNRKRKEASTTSNHQTELETAKKRKESEMPSTPPQKTEPALEKKTKVDGIVNEKPKDGNFIGGKLKEVKNLAAAAKESVKGFAMDMNEDRQSLVNAGVAVLVVAAFGAYLLYKIGSASSSSSKD